MDIRNALRVFMAIIPDHIPKYNTVTNTVDKSSSMFQFVHFIIDKTITRLLYELNGFVQPGGSIESVKSEFSDCIKPMIAHLSLLQAL